MCVWARMCVCVCVCVRMYLCFCLVSLSVCICVCHFLNIRMDVHPLLFHRLSYLLLRWTKNMKTRHTKRIPRANTRWQNVVDTSNNSFVQKASFHEDVRHHDFQDLCGNCVRTRITHKDALYRQQGLGLTQVYFHCDRFVLPARVCFIYLV